MSRDLRCQDESIQDDGAAILAPPAPQWPDLQDGLNILSLKQLGCDYARCTGVWVCDTQGNPAFTFQQGQTAVFYTEYELTQPIEVPIGGVMLRNEQHVNVHGKTTLEYGTEVPTSVPAGSRVRFRQEISLQLCTGVYRFDVRLTTISASDYQNRAAVVQEDLNANILLLCLIIDAGTVTVVARESGEPIRLMHHGVANLPGSCTMSLADAPPAISYAHVAQASEEHSDEPTIVHITHFKAGSQWIRNILAACEPERTVRPELLIDANLKRGLLPGRIYAPIYMAHGEFNKIPRPDNTRFFVVLRDLRDTLVSAYFSVKFSHAIVTQDMAGLRRILSTANTQDEGMLYMMDHWLPRVARMQKSWLEADVPFIRYKDLLEDDTRILERVLIDECGLSTPRQKLHDAIAAQRFEVLTGGRPRGQENPNAHERKGVVGDWRNHFPDWMKRMFKIRYAGLLIAGGFEKDADW